VEILDKAGLRLERAFFAAEGLAHSVPKLLKLDTEHYPAAVAHIDIGFTDFIIVFKNKAIFIRSIPIGAQHLIKERPLYEKKFAEEIKKSLDAYQGEDVEKLPNALLVTGAIEELGFLETALKNSVYQPIRMSSYLKGMSFGEPAARLASAASGASFLNLAACLISSDELKVDLLPEEIKLRKVVEERGKDLIKSGVLVLTVFLLTVFILISKIYFMNAYLKKLDERYDSLYKQVESLEKDSIKIGLIRNYITKRGYSLEVLSELYNVAPEGLKLDEIRFDDQGKLSIRGMADAMSRVFALLENMEKGKYFKEVKTKYTTKRKEGAKEITDFEINCLLVNEGQ
jgi:Tfp pilus assembly protein PilN